MTVNKSSLCFLQGLAHIELVENDASVDGLKDGWYDLVGRLHYELVYDPVEVNFIVLILCKL